MAAAPSYAPSPRSRPLPPSEVVKRLLARFGDRRYISSIRIGAVPVKVRRGYKSEFAGVRPPGDALWATILGPERFRVRSESKPPIDGMIAQWESGIVAGGLRDDFCAAGGGPLVGWMTLGIEGGLSNRGNALGQRFPNPSPSAFRARVDLIGRKFGFHVVSLRLLRPEQIAPLLVVQTDRPRKNFVNDVPAIVSLLNPETTEGNKSAATFEALFFEARDSKGPFVAVDNISRGETEGGEWSWSRNVYPYSHL